MHTGVYIHINVYYIYINIKDIMGDVKQYFENEFQFGNMHQDFP